MTVTSAVVSSRPVGLRIAAALAGALAVAAAAQVAVPLPGTAVPLTLQPLAVLIVGGLLGARFGALSMVMYLAMGAAGLPVFTPLGAPGLARLLGPTGGYLIAYPLAAAVVGWAASLSGGQAVSNGTKPLTALPPYRLPFLGCLLGMALIHIGGAAQLMIITGSAGAAIALGTLPFLLGDGIKVALAALVIRQAASFTRALR